MTAQYYILNMVFWAWMLVNSRLVGDENNEFKLFNHIWADMKGRWTKDGAMVQQGGSIEIHVVNEIPLSSGLGSSAAWGASLSAALLHLHFVAIGAPFDAGKEKTVRDMSKTTSDIDGTFWEGRRNKAEDGAWATKWSCSLTRSGMMNERFKQI